MVLTRQGGVVRQSGAAFQGEKGKQYAQVVVGMVESVMMGVEQLEQGVSAASIMEIRGFVSEIVELSFNRTVSSFYASVPDDMNLSSHQVGGLAYYLCGISTLLTHNISTRREIFAGGASRSAMIHVELGIQ